MTRIATLHTQWMTDPAYKREFEALEADAGLANVIPNELASAHEPSAAIDHWLHEEVAATYDRLEANPESGMTPEHVAERMRLRHEATQRNAGSHTSKIED